MGCLAGILTLVCLLGSYITLSAAEDPPREPGFEQFKLILERNIFDPERTKPISREERRRPDTPPPRNELLSLNGTIRYGGQAFAFFNGSDSADRGAVGVGATIAGLRIVEITSKAITLDREGDRITLDVGRRLQRVGDEPWKLSEKTARLDSADSSPESDESDQEAGEDAGEMSDVLKQMMEKRKKELEQ